MKECYINTKLNEEMIKEIIKQSKEGAHKVEFVLSLSLEEILAFKYPSYKSQLSEFSKKLSGNEKKMIDVLYQIESEHDFYLYDVDKKVLHNIAYSFKDKFIDFIKEELEINE